MLTALSGALFLGALLAQTARPLDRPTRPHPVACEGEARPAETEALRWKISTSSSRRPAVVRIAMAAAPTVVFEDLPVGDPLWRRGFRPGMRLTIDGVSSPAEVLTLLNAGSLSGPAATRR